MTSGNQYLAMPTDFLAAFSLSITNSSAKEFLLIKDVNFLQEYWPTVASTGVPKFYAVFDDSTFLIAPTPNSNFAVEMHYYYRPASLTAGADGGTTWLSTNGPNALLYASLVEAYIYMKGDAQLLATYEKRFEESLMRLKTYAEARENTDAYRKGLPSQERS